MTRILYLISGLAAVVLAQAPTAGSTVTGPGAARVDDYLTRLVPYGFSGAVLIAKDGQIVLKKGYGLADRAARRPYTADMVSSIGSVTKQFTAAAILKLQMEGRLATSDPISRHLPGVPPDKAAITIHHLLTHTAGFAEDLGGRDDEAIDRDALVSRVLAAPLASAPGERFEYSNEGYSLAGAIVERVSGKGYERYLREHLFLPAGMRDTGYLEPAWDLARLPLGYGPEGREWGRIYKRNWLPDGPGWYLRANGGIHSTLDDLFRWHVALESGSVLSADAVKQFQTGHAAVPGMDERYAYGWGIRKTPRGTTVIAHNGGNGFIFADFRRYADERAVIIAMSNQPAIPATELAPRQIDALFFGDRPVVVPPSPVTVLRAQRDALAGTYALEGRGLLTVRATEDGLDVEATDPTLLSAAPLTPPGGRFADLESRSVAILREAAAGNYRPLFEAFNDERPFEVVQGNQTRIWNGWRSEFGAFRKAELLGTGIADGDPAVAVRLHFERGGPTLQLIWGPRRLAGWREMPAAAALALTPQSPSSWVFYSYRLPSLVTVEFSDGGAVTIARGTEVVSGRRRP